MAGYHAKKRLGQNFIKSSDVIDKIIQSINPQADDIIIEVGPGRGALTLPLAESGANIIAVEYDRDLIGYLTKEGFFRTIYGNQYGPSYNLAIMELLI